MTARRGHFYRGTLFKGPATRRVAVSAGFTVVELLLGLGIFAVMGSCVYFTYTNAVRIDRESRHRSELAHGGYWTLTALEEDLERLVYYSYVDPVKGEDRPVFAGAEQELSFVMESPQGLQWVSYSLEEQQRDSVHEVVLGQHFQKNTDQTIYEQTSERRQLSFVRRAAVFKGVIPEDKEIIPSEILIRNVSGADVRFTYARKKAEGDKVELLWGSAWSEEGPPAVVRITLRLADEKTGSVLEMERDVFLPAGKQE